MTKPLFLTIAGSDSIGGAGIQADLKTADRLGLYGCSVITAITAQNSFGVESASAVSPQMIERQLKAVLNDVTPDSVKIGLLPDADSIILIADILKQYRVKNIVVDPVVAPTIGKEFSNDSALDAMIEYLFPLACLITPNIPEFKIFENKINRDDLFHTTNVLLKGGHDEDDVCTDILYARRENSESSEIDIFEFRHERVNTPNTHGSGCVLSSAIACNLAKGNSLKKSVESSIDFLIESMRNSRDIVFGKGGYGPILY